MRCGALQQNRVTRSCWRCRPGERGLGRDGRAASNPVHRRWFPAAAGACAWLARLPASALVLRAATPAQRSPMDCVRRPPGRVAGRGGAIWRVRRRRNRCRGGGSSARTGSWTDRETHRPDPTHAAPATCTSAIAWISRCWNSTARPAPWAPGRQTAAPPTPWHGRVDSLLGTHGRCLPWWPGKPPGVRRRWQGGQR